MRDLDRWKDKVEISLDGRQIFFLFFGSAVAACLIFVVGVLIGKRIEARALALQPAAIEDPLAALDQLGDADEVDEGLTFHKALTPVRAEKATVEPKKADRGDKADKADKPEKAPAEAKKVELKAPPAVSKPAVASAVADDKADDDDKSEARPVVEPKSVEAKSVEAKKVEPIRPLPSPPRPQALPAARPQVVQQSAAKKPDATAAHFTLQLSAFPDKADAEEFMRKIQSAGYKPFLVASEIPGKGVFYRVRVGDYGSRQSAVDAKSEFERKQRIIAYVAKL